MRLIVLIFSLALLVALSFYLGTQWVEHGLSTTATSTPTTTPASGTTTSAEMNNSTTTTEPDTPADTSKPAGATSSEVDGAVTVPPSALSESQRQLLESFGLDPNALTIDQAVIDCVEATLGADRVAEIQAGATPTIPEGMQLLGCYSSD